jgi:hypothetical protein
MDYTVQGPDGAQHVISGPEGASDSEVIAQAQQLFAPSKLESFGRGVENNFPLANQAIAAGSAALGDKSYSQNLGEQNKDIATAKQANPVSYGAGAVTGALAPLAIPGVGEAMEAAPVATNAALGAANAVGGTDIAQNPGEALKQAGEGAAIGGVLGKVMPTGTQTADELTSYANKKGVQALNLKPGMLGIPEDELEALGAKAHEMGLIEGETPERAAKAQDLLQQVGAQIQDIGGGSQALQDPSQFVDALHGHLQESSEIYGAEANPEATMYRQGIANLQQPNLTFDKLQQLKSAYGQRAFDQFGNVRNDAAANVYGQLKEAMKSIIDSSPEQYQDLMNQYSDLKDISGGITAQLGKEQAAGVQAKGFGMVGKLAGMVEGNNPIINAGTAAGLAAAGHPFMGLGALTPIMSNPGALSGAARGLAGAVPKVAAGFALGTNDAVTSYLLHTLNSNPQKLGRYAQPLINAAKTGGSQGLAAQHFLLATQYPEYNSMMQDQDNGQKEQ